MTKKDFIKIVNDLKFDDADIDFLISNQMSTNIFDYTPTEIKYIKEASKNIN